MQIFLLLEISAINLIPCVKRQVFFNLFSYFYLLTDLSMFEKQVSEPSAWIVVTDESVGIESTLTTALYLTYKEKGYPLHQTIHSHCSNKRWHLDLFITSMCQSNFLAFPYNFWEGLMSKGEERNKAQGWQVKKPVYLDLGAHFWSPQLFNYSLGLQKKYLIRGSWVKFGLTQQKVYYSVLLFCLL